MRLPSQVSFYYPDVSVICRPNPPTDSFQDEPAVLFEVLSEQTRRIDESEKRDAYLSLASLHAYVLAVLALPELQIELPLADVYDGVTFNSGPSDSALS